MGLNMSTTKISDELSIEIYDNDIVFNTIGYDGEPARAYINNKDIERLRDELINITRERDNGR